MYCAYVVLPIAALLVNMLAQILGFRYLRQGPRGLLKSVFMGFICGFGFLLVMEIFYLQHVNKGYALTNIVIYLALCNGYFHFVNMGETARRIRILRELMLSEDGLSMEEILVRYNAREIVDRRFGRLLRSGQVALKDNRYYIGKPAMIIIAKFIIALKIIILGKKSEFG